MRIALIKTGALGDVVRTTALVPGLRRHFPDLHLTWITARSALDLVRHHPEVDRYAAIEDAEDAPWRSGPYDWILSLDDGRDECRLASRLAASSGGRISGGYEALDGTLAYSPDVEPWFGMGILRPADRGGLDRANELKKTNEKTVAALLYECLGLPLPVGRTSIPVPDSEQAPALRWLADNGLADRHPLIGLNTGAGGRWRFKSWGEDQSADLARRLHDEIGAGIVVLGGGAEQNRNDRIVVGADRAGVIAAPTDFSLLGFTALLGRLDLLVTSDSLALHLAVSQGVPTVSFFGPTSATEIEIYGGGEKVLTPLDCRCCYLKDCDVRPHCMQSIGVEDLYGAVLRSLSSGEV